MTRLIKSIGFGIMATAIMGSIVFLLLKILNWLMNLAPNILPVALPVLFGLVVFSVLAYQDKTLFRD